MTTTQRWLVFNAVGAMGFGLQMVLLWTFVRIAALMPAAAAGLAIELTVLHNFVWHVILTWRDRPCSAREAVRRLVRFHAANGAISLVGGMSLVWAGTQMFDLHFLVANLMAVAVCAVLNYFVSDRWAFRRPAEPAPVTTRHLAASRTVQCLVALIIVSAEAGAAELKPETLRAFAASTQQAEEAIARQEREASPFLWLAQSPARVARARRGEVVVGRLTGDDPADVPGGLVHDWIGGAWIGGATLEQVLAIITDVDRHAEYYAPEVVRSRLLGRDGETRRTYLRLYKHKIITVVLDSEHVAHLERIGPARARSWSRSVKVVEVDNPGRSDERVLPVGQGHGFLWALNSYWRFEEADGGVYVECRAVSLTRRVPTLLVLLIGPIVSGLPRDSLVQTLAATRTGVAARKPR
jgi:putative flippase GtrA